jgi:hypothetical protein
MTTLPKKLISSFRPHKNICACLHNWVCWIDRSTAIALGQIQVSEHSSLSSGFIYVEHWSVNKFQTLNFSKENYAVKHDGFRE